MRNNNEMAEIGAFLKPKDWTLNSSSITLLNVYV
jgi:hypothetical protein